MAELEAAIAGDIDGGCLRVADVPSSLFHLPKSLIASSGKVGLRTLDALQLASALTSGTSLFVTADTVLAEIAVVHGLRVRAFLGKG